MFKNRIYVIIFLIVSFLFAEGDLFADEIKITKGLKTEPYAKPNVFSIEIGTKLSDSDFKALKLPEEENYYAAFHRVILGIEEIYPLVVIELIGAYEEGAYKVLESYYFPLDDALGYVVKGAVHFKSWKSPDTFTLEVRKKTIQIKIKRKGEFEVTVSK